LKREHALADGRRLGKRDALVDDDRAHVNALSKRRGSWPRFGRPFIVVLAQRSDEPCEFVRQLRIPTARDR